MRSGGGLRVASYISLNYWELAVASLLVLIDAGLSIVFGLRIHRSLLVAAIRMTVQLALVGLVLTALFAVVSPLWTRSEEHTSELQSLRHLVCRLLLEKK